MKNHLFVIVVAILYMFIIVLLVRKAKDIFHNPEKYNAIKGWKEYRSSFWYEPLSDYHNKFLAKNYVAPIVVGIPSMLGILISYFFLGYLIQKYILVPDGAIFLQGDGLWIGALGLLFFGIYFIYWIIFHCKNPIMIACSMTAFNSKYRSDNWKKLVCAMLVVSIICLSITFAGINTYAYASDQEFVFNNFWQIDEEHILYKDIESVETEYRVNNDQTEYYFSYFIVTGESEEKIDILKYCSPEELLYIHNQIKNEKVTIRKGVIKSDIYQEMKTTIQEVEVEMVNELFQIGN